MAKKVGFALLKVLAVLSFMGCGQPEDEENSVPRLSKVSNNNGTNHSEQETLIGKIDNVTALTATKVSDTELKITWEHSDAAASTFEIFRGDAAGNFASIINTAVGEKSYSDKGLTLNTLYKYKVIAKKAGLISVAVETQQTTCETAGSLYNATSQKCISEGPATYVCAPWDTSNTAQLTIPKTKSDEFYSYYYAFNNTISTSFGNCGYSCAMKFKKETGAVECCARFKHCRPEATACAAGIPICPGYNGNNPW